jgi:hypothetical protein
MRVQPGCGLSQTLRHKKLQFWREIADSADLSARFMKSLQKAKCFIFRL